MKIVRLAIFLTGITGLGMGGIMTLSSLRSNQEEAVLRANETLKTQATQFVDQFYGMLEATKNINAASTSIPTYVTERAVVKINQGSPSEFESFTSNDPTLPINAQPDFGLQERILTALKTDLSIPELQISRISMGTYPLTDVGNKEAIYIATPIFKVEKGVTDPTVIDKVNITMIDPVKAFSGLQKITSSDGESGYMINKRGKVLAHTVPAFIGTDMKKVDTLKTNLDNLFLGAQTGTVGKYTNVDGTQEQVAFVRAGTTPFAFAIEERAKPPVLSSAWISDQVDSGAARTSLGLIFVIVAASFVLFTGISIYTSVQLGKMIQLNPQAESDESQASQYTEMPLPNFASKIAPGIIRAEAPQTRDPQEAQSNSHFQPSAQVQAQANISQASPIANPFAPPPAVERSTTALVEARDQIALEREQLAQAIQGLNVPRDFAREFVNKAEKCYTLEGVEKELVQLSSEISESPVLYFRYHRRNQSLALASVAGEVKIANYSNMQAYVRKDIEMQVEQMADDGKVASISNYGPISKLIMSHLNVAHFEAWAVTSHPEVSAQSKLVGVVVILQAGMRSAQARPLLARILRDAGNYLYAQTNKIRPRSSLYQPNSPMLEDSNLS